MEETKTIASTLDEIMGKNTAMNDDPNRQPTICPICGKPKEIYKNLTYFKGWFHQDCDCELKAWEEEMKRIRDQKRKERVDELLQLSMKAPLYDKVRFENTEIGNYASYDKAYSRCKKYCEIADQVLEANQGIYIYGEKGCGKTHLTYCMMWELVNKLYSCIMTSFNDIKRYELEGKHYLVENMIDCDFLFIDDLGVEVVQKNDQDNWTQELIYKILNDRYNANKPVIFSSNYSINELATQRGFQERTIDRINQMSTAIIKINDVPSYRKKQVEKNKALF
jgi:DNA replication protein DnaC